MLATGGDTLTIRVADGSAVLVAQLAAKGRRFVSGTVGASIIKDMVPTSDSFAGSSKKGQSYF